LQAEPNPLFDEIIKELPNIETVHSSVRLTTFPMSTFIRCFQRDYFLYWGCISIGNIRNSVLWLISRRPIGISVEQVIHVGEAIVIELNWKEILPRYTRLFPFKIATFRMLLDEEQKPILSNRRPLQYTGDRRVYHVCPSGFTYITILPIRLVDFCDKVSKTDDGRWRKNDG